MSRTKVINKRTGEIFPDKSRKKLKNKKFFGFKSGNGKGKKGVDFINYGYPLELRHRSVIKQHIQDELTKDELNII
jgi:hypothetical protein